MTIRAVGDYYGQHFPHIGQYQPINSIDFNRIAMDIEKLKIQIDAQSKLLGLIMTENPEILEKFENIKNAWEEYCLFRDLVINKE